MTAVFTVTDDANYNAIPSMTATLTIVKKPLSAWVVTGIALGGTIASTVVIFVVFYIIRRRRALAAEQEAALAAGKENALSLEELAAVRNLLQDSQNGYTPLPDTLTRAEFEVIGALFEGLPRKQIAEKLFISKSTVNFHIANIFDKCDCSSINELLLKYKK